LKTEDCPPQNTAGKKAEIIKHSKRQSLKTLRAQVQEVPGLFSVFEPIFTSFSQAFHALFMLRTYSPI
jgi:hypothetical protein